MAQSYKTLLGLAFLLSFSAVSYAETTEQSVEKQQLYAQLQELKIQMSLANQKIAALEEHNNLEKQMSKNLFADSSDTLHGRNR